MDILIVLSDAVGAAVTTVVNEVVGVPSGPVGSHLSQPWPDVMSKATNRDGVIDRADRLGNQIVSGKGPGTLVRSSVDLHGGINRKHREYYRYSENNNEEQFLLHEATDVEGSQMRLRAQ